MDTRVLVSVLGPPPHQHLVPAYELQHTLPRLRASFEAMGIVKTKGEIADDILAYLTQNPDAQDTLAGIVEWWLLEQELRYRTIQVREAVADLVQRGFITERKGEDAQVHYCVNRGTPPKCPAVVKEESK